MKRYYINTQCGFRQELENYSSNPPEVWKTTMKALRAKGMKYKSSYCADG